MIDVTVARKVQAALVGGNAEARLAAERAQLALAAGAIIGTWVWDPLNDTFHGGRVLRAELWHLPGSGLYSYCVINEVVCCMSRRTGTAQFQSAGSC